MGPDDLPAKSVGGDDPLVRFVDVSKSYDGRSLVVEGLDLSIRKGEFLTLLGPSGSGKTTTLMMLAGFEQPSGGRIELRGRAIEREPAWRRNLGMVFQDYALFPHLDVLGNVAFPLAVRNVSREERNARAREALAMVKLAGYETRRPAQLSGGQQQRVALARAMVFRPEMILMDEPLGALDKQLREEMQLEIKRLQVSSGVTVVYVTHDQSEALVMSDRVAVFEGGRIRQVGAPAELYERPSDAFVARFIGENNQLPGCVEVILDGSAVVRTDGGAAIRAITPSTLGIGQRAVSSVRPERVALGVEARQMDNAFQGVARERDYLGDHVRLRIEVEGVGEVTAKIRVGGSQASPEPGDRLDIGWNAADCRALPVA